MITMQGGALFSPDRTYRYLLTRTWNPLLPTLTFVMLNPSDADEERNDPTVRKCFGFADRWAYGSMLIVNLYALVTSNPTDLIIHPDPVGPANAEHLRYAVTGHDVVAAWGASLPSDKARIRAKAIGHVLRTTTACFTLGLTKDGYPRHPCRLGYDTPRVLWTDLLTASR